MALQIPTNNFPTICAGIQTLKCACGWESVHIIPEEHENRLLAIFDHMREVHKLTLPDFTFHWY